MKASTLWPTPALSLATLLVLVTAAAAESGRVTTLRTPDGGIQPQAAVDPAGTVHLVFYKGAPVGGDVYYARQRTGEESFSKPMRVNSQARSAISMGTIRGAQLAVGKNGRVHVVWNGGQGATQPMVDGKKVTPLLYTRLLDDGTGFEPERNLITYAAGLDGGSSVAADPRGNVYVTWHAHPPGNTNFEAGRAVFVARSADDGRTFSREERATTADTGACACCGMRAFADSSGAVYVMYRAAQENLNRDEILLTAGQPGAPFQMTRLHRWKIPTCPMSSVSLTEGKEATLAAWETAGQVYYASVNSKSLQVSKPIAPLGGGNRKHPVAIANAKGETLFVWTEGTGWERGGAVAWQIFDGEGKATREKGRADGVPVWSLATAFAKPDGNFVIVY